MQVFTRKRDHQSYCKAVPLQAWSGQVDYRKLKFPDYVTTAQDDGKVVSLTHRPPYPQEIILVFNSVSRLIRPQGHSAIGRIMSMKNPLTPTGIETATFRFVAQYLNHCATVRSTVVSYKG